MVFLVCEMLIRVICYFNFVFSDQLFLKFYSGIKNNLLKKFCNLFAVNQIKGKI